MRDLEYLEKTYKGKEVYLTFLPSNALHGIYVDKTGDNTYCAELKEILTGKDGQIVGLSMRYAKRGKEFVEFLPWDDKIVISLSRRLAEDEDEDEDTDSKKPANDGAAIKKIGLKLKK